MADGMCAYSGSDEIIDAHTIGFVAAMSGASLADNPFYPFTRVSTQKFSQWREGWIAYSNQCITEHLKEIFWDVGQMRNPATQEHFEMHGRLPELLEQLLLDRCVRP